MLLVFCIYRFGKMSILPVLTHEYILVGAPRQFTRNKNVGEFVLDLMRDHGNDVAMVNIVVKEYFSLA